jgi:hypothetical protein
MASGVSGKDKRTRVAPIAALLALSLLWACAALRVDLLPSLVETLPYLERQVLPLALLSMTAGAISIASGANWRRSIPGSTSPGSSIPGSLPRASVWIGLGLFTAPAMLVFFADTWISGLARTAFFTLTPVFAVVFEPYLGLSCLSSSSSTPRQRAGLLASLAAVAGSLLVFPVATPNSLPSAAAFIAVIAAAASVAAANCHGTAKASSLGRDATGQLAAIAAIAGATGALTLAAASALLEHPVGRWSALAPELFWSAAIELPALLLLFWLMSRLSAPRMATRYVCAPLLALLSGVVLEHAGRAVRPLTWLGLIWMAAGAGWMLFAPREETSLSILPAETIDITDTTGTARQ